MTPPGHTSWSHLIAACGPYKSPRDGAFSGPKVAIEEHHGASLTQSTSLQKAAVMFLAKVLKWHELNLV